MLYFISNIINSENHIVKTNAHIVRKEAYPLFEPDGNTVIQKLNLGACFDSTIYNSI